MAAIENPLRPAVAPELPQIKAQLPALRYPVENAAALTAQLANRTFQFRSKKVDAKVGVAQLAASAFPITSEADFDDKISKLMLAHPVTTTAAAAALSSITGQLPALRFPVENAAALVTQLSAGNRKYNFHGKDVPPEAGVARIPASSFPITSQADFDAKIGKLLPAATKTPVKVPVKTPVKLPTKV